jgi:type I restriction enzyme M protein
VLTFAKNLKETELSEDFNTYNPTVEQFVNRIWSISDILRSRMDSDRIHAVLFLLSLYKDGIVGVNETRWINTNGIFNKASDSRKYRGVLDAFYPIFNRVPEDVLTELVYHIAQVPLDELKEFFSEIFDGVLYRFSSHAGKRSEGIIQPKELTQFTFKLIQETHPRTIYNPFAGLASFGLGLDNEQLYVGQEINISTWALGTLRLLAYNKTNNVEFLNEDSIDRWRTNERFDLVVTNPPFGQKFSLASGGSVRHDRIESMLFEQGYNNLSQNGRLITFVSLSFLFSERREEKAIRRFLVDNDLIETIISMPPNLLSNTSIPFAIIVINKSKVFDSKTRMIDASKFVIKQGKTSILNQEALSDVYFSGEVGTVSEYVSNNEIFKNGYSLNVPRYFLPEYKGVQLGSFSERVKGSSAGGVWVGKQVKIRNLKSDKTNPYLNINEIELQEFTRSNSRLKKIEESCLLVALRWKTIKPTVFKYNGEPIFVGNDILPLRINQEIALLEYVALQLLTSQATHQFEAYSVGSTIPFISTKNLLDIKIELPSLDQQNGAVKAIKLSELESRKNILKVQEKLNSQAKKAKEDLESKQHNIRQHLKNVTDSLAVLMKFMENNDGVLRKGDIISKRRGTTVETRFLALKESLDDVVHEISNLTNEVEFDEATNLDLNKSLLRLIEVSRESKKFKINYEFDSISFDLYGIKPRVNIGKKSLAELFNNIIENTDRHAGFNQEDVQNEMLILLSATEKGVQLKFMNNGKPFPKGLSKNLGVKGIKAGRSANKGIGIWKVFQIADHYNINHKVIDEPIEEYPVGFNFLFNQNNKS